MRPVGRVFVYERSMRRIGYGLCRLAAVRRGSIVRITIYGVLAGILASLVAVLVPWLPTSASEEIDRIEFTFWFTTIICIGVFAVVAAAILYSILKFRAQPDDDSDGPPIHGHTGLEIVWTAIPTVLVTAISVVSAVVLAKNDDAGPNPLRIAVTAQQFAWKFEYPGDEKLTSGQLVLPVERAGQADAPLARRDPRVLGARVRAEVGRRAGDRDDARDHAEPDGRVPRSSAPSSAGSATRRCARRCASSSAPSTRTSWPARRAPAATRPPARRSSPPRAAAAATRSSPPARTPRSARA